MPKKVTRAVKRISTKIKASLRKRRLIKRKAVVTKKISSVSSEKSSPPLKRTTVKKTLPITLPPRALTSNSLHIGYPSQISLKPYRPFWFMAQWQLSPIELEIWKKQTSKKELALKLYSSKGQCVQTILIPVTVRNWHLYTESTDSFYIELGFFNKKNQFLCLCRSNPAKLSFTAKTKPSRAVSVSPPRVSASTAPKFTPVQQRWIEEFISNPSLPYSTYGGS